MKIVSSLGVFAILCASSQAAFFDWETIGAGGQASVSQTDSGLTATGTAVGGLIQGVDFSAAPGFASYGNRSLTGYYEGQARPVIKVAFSSLVTDVMVQVGDASIDDDGLITLAAYDSANNLVDSDTFNYGTVEGPISMSVSAANIAYVIGSTSLGFGEFANSVIWDNFTVTPVPEPATCAALGLGAAALIRRRRLAKR